MRAPDVTSMNLGAAMAASIPKIRITTISSISVKPRICLFIFVSLTNLTTYRVNLACDLIIHKLCSGFPLLVNPSADCLGVHPLFRQFSSSVSLGYASREPKYFTLVGLRLADRALLDRAISV